MPSPHNSEAEDTDNGASLCPVLFLHEKANSPFPRCLQFPISPKPIALLPFSYPCKDRWCRRRQKQEEVAAETTSEKEA